jgi:Domain of unknown function (DUF5668)
MKNDKLIPGTILVLIGAAILLSNYGYLHFHWSNFWRLWPIFLVIGGINLVFASNKSPWATILKISVVIFGVGLLLFGNFGDRYNFWPGWHYGNHYNNDNNNNNNDRDDDDDDDGDAGKGTPAAAFKGNFNEPYAASVKLARLNISGGATAYNIADTSNQLFSASIKHNINMYLISHSNEDSVYIVNVKMKDHSGINFDGDDNEVNMRLNPYPVWEVNVDAGAAAIDFDLSNYKVKEVKLHGGAASFKVKMGMPVDITNVDVSTGLADVEISIPKDAACSIDSHSGLSGDNFDDNNDFIKKSDDTYETPGFANSKIKMYIHIKGGLSSFNVSQY